MIENAAGEGVGRAADPSPATWESDPPGPIRQTHRLTIKAPPLAAAGSRYHRLLLPYAAEDPFVTHNVHSRGIDAFMRFVVCNYM
ncbi:hypothetical protein CEXT_542601 [Caerostris extrusa]|uniref:Uncharacterized protein n=1 Tax=Caerostris extrusa TaxID=172846 RepID=A0AAV4PTC0_CAEEX|nr:hypothetical protein CEXT_542601 [Caerostris extrusa]